MNPTQPPLLRHAAPAVAALAFAVLPPAVGAQSVDDWLQKMAESVDRAPYSLDYVMKMQVEQAGNQMSIEATADMLYGSPSTLQADMQMNMSMASLPEPMEITMNMVADGTSMWMVMSNPMMGGEQILRMPLDKLEDAQTSAGIPGMSGSMDPFAQIEQLKQLMDFEIGDSADGLITLVGTPTDDFEATLGAAAAMLGGEMHMTIEQDTGLPRRVTMGPADAPVMEMVFQNYEFLGASDLPADAFTYTPPEGAQVMEPLG